MKPHEVDNISIDRQSVELLECSIEYVAVHIAANAVHTTHVGVLPKAPGPFVLELADVVMSYPIWIFVKLRRTEIFLLEAVASVENRFHAIVTTDYRKPLANSLLQLSHREVASLLHIEHRRQVASFEVNLLEEEARLLSRIDIRREEMVGTAQKVVLACLIEVVVEVLVDNAHAFSCLDENEAYGFALDAGIAQPLPVDILLIVADVKAMDFIALRIVRLAIDGFPAERERSDEEVVKKKKVGPHDQAEACQQSPQRHTSPKGFPTSFAT